MTTRRAEGHRGGKMPQRDYINITVAVFGTCIFKENQHSCSQTLALNTQPSSKSSRKSMKLHLEY